jgi:8-oxo-dGTP pyrophosphatase MutT (NUDIX family)
VPASLAVDRLGWSPHDERCGSGGQELAEVTPGQPTPAAVLIPFYRDSAGALRLVLIERTRHGPHGGQIALPGGRREPTDQSMRDTAVREACEELGLRSDEVEVLGELPAMSTRTTGFLVWPFVARLRAVPQQWRTQQGEVASVLEVRVDQLADPASADEQEMDFPTWRLRQRVPVRRIEGHTVWGLTLRILEPLLPRVLAGEYPI